MPYCVVKWCKNNNIGGKVNTGLSFHKFPRDPVLRDKWTQIIQRSKRNSTWTPSDYCVVCSAHFEEDDMYFAKTGLRRLHNDAIPTKYIFTYSQSNIGNNSVSLDKSEPKRPSQSHARPKKFLDVSVKIERDSSDSDSSQSLEDKSPPQSTYGACTNANRKLLICFDNTDKTKKDSVDNSVVPSKSTNDNNIITIIEHDPLSIKEEIKMEIEEHDPMDSVSPSPSQSNISIISLQHQSDNKKKKTSTTNVPAVNVTKLSADTNSSNKKEYVRVDPNVFRLERDVTRLQMLRIRYRRKMKTYQQQIRRLKKRNATMKSKLKSMGYKKPRPNESK